MWEISTSDNALRLLLLLGNSFVFKRWPTNDDDNPRCYMFPPMTPPASQSASQIAVTAFWCPGLSVLCPSGSDCTKALHEITMEIQMDQNPMTPLWFTISLPTFDLRSTDGRDLTSREIPIEDRLFEADFSLTSSSSRLKNLAPLIGSCIVFPLRLLFVLLLPNFKRTHFLSDDAKGLCSSINLHQLPASRNLRNSTPFDCCILKSVFESQCSETLSIWMKVQRTKEVAGHQNKNPTRIRRLLRCRTYSPAVRRQYFNRATVYCFPCSPHQNPPSEQQLICTTFIKSRPATV